MVETIENNKETYLAEAEKTAMSWKLSEKARADWEEAEAVWDKARKESEEAREVGCWH